MGCIFFLFHNVSKVAHTRWKIFMKWVNQCLTPGDWLLPTQWPQRPIVILAHPWLLQRRQLSHEKMMWKESDASQLVYFQPSAHMTCCQLRVPCFSASSVQLLWGLGSSLLLSPFILNTGPQWKQQRVFHLLSPLCVHIRTTLAVHSSVHV